MEQSESITQAIPKDPGTPRPGISARQVFSLKPDRSRQRVQPPTGLFQTPHTPTSLSDQVLRQRETPGRHPPKTIESQLERWRDPRDASCGCERLVEKRRMGQSQG